MMSNNPYVVLSVGGTYIIRQLLNDTVFVPVYGLRGIYQTAEQATAAAENEGLTISATGDTWQVLTQLERRGK